MKTTVNFDNFACAFRDIRPDNFSPSGLLCLFEYLESLEEDLGQEIELDVIAFCCDYSEDQFSDVADNYSIDLDGCEDDDDIAQTVCDYLMDHGVYVGRTEATVIYQQF